MGIFDRLGDVIRSYLNDEDSRLFGSPSRREGQYGDPDLEAAFEELNDFLGQGSKEGAGKFSRTGGFREGRRGGASGWEEDFAGNRRAGNGSWEDPGNTRQEQDRNRERIPESLRRDFEELGLPFGASSGDCKAAYKRLLKLHHPDRHAGHAGNMKKATEKSARINAAYDRIEKWRQTGE
ncbi:MAG: J domain-containing protein [Treponema sp.]|jgi:hypothetical protein|nr:J domain-containing protein [Treponema sp.]